MAFFSTSFSSTTGTPFAVGKIHYYNGTILADSGADSVDLALTLSFTNPAGLVATPNYLLTLINTPNVGTPAQMADIISFPTVLPTQTFVIGGTTYTLALDVGTVTGSGFSSQHTFSVLENASADATLMGTITAAVPEPVSSGLLLAGLGVLGFAARRRKGMQHAA
jgi:hypothetical protein